jgi:hypothetical protein
LLTRTGSHRSGYLKTQKNKKIKIPDIFLPVTYHHHFFPCSGRRPPLLRRPAPASGHNYSGEPAPTMDGIQVEHLGQSSTATTMAGSPPLRASVRVPPSNADLRDRRCRSARLRPAGRQEVGCCLPSLNSIGKGAASRSDWPVEVGAD